jgi:hypothetical protein
LIDLHGRTPVMTISLPWLGAPATFLTAARGRIFVQREPGSTPTHITVIDGSTGASVGDVPRESTGIFSADERLFYALS